MQLKLINKPAGTIVPNEFIQNSMGAPEGFVAAYLFGLMYSSCHESVDLGVFSARLRMPESEIIEAYEYWQKKGFAKIHNGSELSFEFGVFKKLDNVDELYSESEFFQELQNIFGSRQLSPADYVKIFDYTSVFMLPKKVVLILAQYCVDKKGKRVSIAYMDKVAETWAENGINTEEKAAKYIGNEKQKESGLLEILEQLGITNRRATKDESDLFDKWTKEWGFTLSAIRTACSHTTSSRNPSMKYLDSILYQLKQAGKTTSRTISESKSEDDTIIKPIQQILHNMGSTNVKPNIEQISLYKKWTLVQGFNNDIIDFAVREASKRGNMPFKYLDDILTNWYNNGIDMLEEAHAYVKHQQRNDSKIQAIFKAVGITKIYIDDAQRENYKKWNEEWGISANAILLAAESSSSFRNPISYLNRLLSSWHEKEVKTVTQAKQALFANESLKSKNKSYSSLGSNTRPTENYDHLADNPWEDEGE